MSEFDAWTRRQRHQKILQLLTQQPIITVDELVNVLEASVATVRRDINALAQAKLLKRIGAGRKRWIQLRRRCA
ncbi:MAG: DeoR family transcriptional regulator [Thiolinea sp.]